MKFRRRHSPLPVLFLPILLSTVAARSIQDPSSGSALLAGKIKYETDEPAVLPAKANPVGTKDAPVDGKDGLPHQGPFVETGAERDRKKIKGSDDEELVASSPAGQETIDPDLPVSNDGVMDDPHRLGPKEGTRGTEGGVSEKSKEKSKESSYANKVPDSPKEKLPLPHSEAETIGDMGSTKLEEEEKQLLEVMVHHPHFI